MSCEEIRRQMHEFIDLRLSAVASAEFDLHLENCPECRLALDDLTVVRQALAVRHSLPEAARDQMLRQLQRRRRRGLSAVLAEGWDHIYTFFRDLDRPVIWSKLSAVPVTLVFFMALLLQFSPPSHLLMVPVFSPSEWAADNVRIHSVQLRPTSAQMKDLVNAAWKLPYEDSLSLVAEITPDGDFVGIEDILEHPKSVDLLNAVDLTFRGGRLELLDRGQSQHYAIISFQKIDVYEGL